MIVESTGPDGLRHIDLPVSLLLVVLVVILRGEGNRRKNQTPGDRANPVNNPPRRSDPHLNAV